MTSFPLIVEVTPNSLQLKPGGSEKLSVKITNVSDIVQHYQVTIVGLPSDEYWSTEPAVTKLKPRESGVIQVRIALPEKGGILGRRYNLGVHVTSPTDPDVSRSADLALDVTPMSGITLTATPLTAYGKSSAAYDVVLKNTGNEDLSVDLVAADDQGLAKITLTPDKLYVQAAQQGQPAVSQKAQLVISAKSIRAGQERRSTIAIKAQVDEETRGEAQVTFIQPPRIPPPVFRTLGIVLAVAVMAGSILLGGKLGSASPAPGHATDASTTSAPPPPQPPPTPQPPQPPSTLPTPPA